MRTLHFAIANVRSRWRFDISNPHEWTHESVARLENLRAWWRRHACVTIADRESCMVRNTRLTIELWLISIGRPIVTLYNTGPISVALWSHLHVKNRPVGATYFKTIFPKLSGTCLCPAPFFSRENRLVWLCFFQLQGQRGCYGVYISLFFTKIASRGTYGTDFREGVTVALYSLWYIVWLVGGKRAMYMKRHCW